MGFQNGNDNSQQPVNERNNASSVRRSSGIKAVEATQNGNQDKRLSQTGKMEGE